MNTFQIALTAGIILTAIILTREAAGWRLPGSTVSRRQRIIRTCSGVTLILLLGLILTGDVLGVISTANTHKTVRQALVAIAYVSACVGAGCLLVVLALLDFQEVLRAYRRSRREMREELQRKDVRGQ